MTEPDLSREEYRERVTELAKTGIRKTVVHNGRVPDEDELYLVTDPLVYSEGDAPIPTLAEEHPLAVRSYTPDEADSWWPDAKDVVGGQSPTDAVADIEQRIVARHVRLRAEQLIDGEWDAIKTENTAHTVTETTTYYDRSADDA